MALRDRIKTACKTAVDNVLREGTTDVDLFAKPFEIDFLNNNVFRDHLVKTVTDAVEEAICKQDICHLKIHKIGHVLVPKKSLSDFRRCAYVDVYDEIVFLTLVLLLAKDIEKHRINKSARKVFSYRFLRSQTGYIFDSSFNYTAFKNEASKKQKQLQNKVQVNCDISNFYDRLNLHRLNSILLSFENVDPKLIDILDQLLLYWANRDSYGIPVGSNASRILAEAALIEVDNVLQQHNINFCRFVDDYRIFASNAQKAHSYLAILNKALSEEGLFLNTAKTHIFDISEYTSPKHIIDTKCTINEDFDTSEVGDPVKQKIIRGYTGLIPTKFKELSNIQITKFASNNLDQLIKSAKDNLLLEPKEITDLIKTIVAKNAYNYLCELPEILLKYPQFIPYLVNAVLKKAENISKSTIEQIEEHFQEWFKDEELPEYIHISLILLFASEPFNRNDIVINHFRKLNRNAGDYVGRAILESLKQVSRKEALELRNYYYRADLWEKRAILRLVKNSIPEPELRPFLKDVKIHDSDDLFIDWLIRKST